MASASGIRAGKAFVEVGMKDKLTGGLNKLQKRFKAFGSSLTAVGAKISAIGGAGLAAGLAAVSKFAAAGDQIEKMAIKTGFSAEELSRLKFAMEQSGGSILTLDKAVKGMQTQLLNLDRGLSTAVDSFDDLGLTVNDFIGLNAEQKFALIAERLAGVGDVTKRAGLALSIFGRAGRDMLPFIKEGVAGMQALKNEADALGLTIGSEQAAAAAEFANAWGRIKQQLGAVVFQIGGALAPSLTDLIGKITPVAKRVIEWVKANKPLILTIFKVTAAVTAAGIAIIGLGGAFILAGAAISAAMTMVSVASAILTAATAPIGLVAAALASTAVGMTALGAVILTQTDIGKSALALLGKGFGELKERAMASFGGIRKAVMSGDIALAWKILTLSLKQEWLGASIFLQEKTLGIRDTFQDVMGAMHDAWAVFVNFFQNSWRTATGFIAKKLAPLLKLLDSSIDVDAVIREIDADTNRKIQSGDRSLLGGISNRDQERSDRKAAFREELEASKQALAASRKDLTAAIAKTNEIPAVVAEKPGAPDKPINKVLQENLVAAVARVTDPINARSKAGIDRQLAAIQGIRGANPEKETAANTKAMLEEQQKSNQKLDKLTKKVQPVKPGKI